MSITVREIYDQVTYVMTEDLGFTLGIFSEAQFLHCLGVVLLNLDERAPLDKKIFTTKIVGGVRDYLSPEDLMGIELCFVGGKIIEQVGEEDLLRGQFEWKKQIGPPRQWHQDNLEVKHLELFPTPLMDGTDIPGDGSPIGKYGDFYPTEGNLTMVGPGAPSKTSWAIGDTLDGIPDSFGPYLVYGILEQIFGADGETRDVQRAAYCQARFEEAVALANAIAQTELMEEDDA